MVIGKKEIEVVQGDTFQRNVHVKNMSTDLIGSIKFSCNKLGINKNLIYDSDNDKYILILTSEETKSLEVGIADYDLTIIFTDDSVKTVSYRSLVRILPKTNKVE